MSATIVWSEFPTMPLLLMCTTTRVQSNSIVEPQHHEHVQPTGKEPYEPEEPIAPQACRSRSPSALIHVFDG